MNGLPHAPDPPWFSWGSPSRLGSATLRGRRRRSAARPGAGGYTTRACAGAAVAVSAEREAAEQ